MNITITLDKESALLVTYAMKDSINNLIACGDDTTAKMVTEVVSAIRKEIDRQSGLKS